MTEDAGKVRLRTPDCLKGLIMIVIVIVHITVLVPGQGGADRDFPLYLQFLYLGMMLFFIISGYFYRPGRSSGRNIRRRFVQLMVPNCVGLVVLPVILYVYLLVLGQGPDTGDLAPNFMRMFGNTHFLMPLDSTSSGDPGIIAIYRGYYFLQIMAFAFVIFYALVERTREDDRRTVAVIAVLLVLQMVMLAIDVVLPFWLNLVPIAAAFMFVGEWLARQDVISWVESHPVREPRYWIRLVGAVAGTVVLLVLFPPGTGFDVYRFGSLGIWSVAPYFLEATLASYIFIVIGSVLAAVPVLRDVLSAVGRHTIAILCLHLFVIKLIIAPFHQLTPVAIFPKLPTGEALLVAVLTLALITVVAELLPVLLRKIRSERGH